MTFIGILTLARKLRRWRDLGRTARQMSVLDDRMLRDIGLDRSDIPSLIEDLRRTPGSRERTVHAVTANDQLMQEASMRRARRRDSDAASWRPAA